MEFLRYGFGIVGIEIWYKCGIWIYFRFVALFSSILFKYKSNKKANLNVLWTFEWWLEKS